MSETPTPSGYIDPYDPTANMYGCKPCPKCGENYRFPFQKDGVVVVQCDDCGFSEPLAEGSKL